ncbi:MAG TPA: fluoride efflux transporter CrcB [Sandaracinaceae bacterium LLY-WYZ-13_1]|nr:fluoride efflux transporter CrcB [Sandaracinaceae bacterium LLY-WYZ-13_1]
MWKLVLIALGGAVGTSFRYGVGLGMTHWLGRSFPFGTLAANVLGSFLLGVVMEAAGDREIAGVQAKLVLGTGVMGGFTTYSSFNLETIRLAEQGAWGRAGLYLGATVVVCVLAGVGGVALARSLKGPA